MGHRIRNVSDITTAMVETLEGLLDGTLDASNAKARASVAKVILTSCVVQMEYARMTESREPIRFLGSNISRRSIGPTPVTPTAPEGPPPPKSDFTSLVVTAIEGQDAMTEQQVAARMADTGLVTETYFAQNPDKPGGPFAVLRGTLLGLRANGTLVMEKNEEGRATFKKAMSNEDQTTPTT